MHVNEVLVEYFLHPLSGGADSDSQYELYKNVDVNDENQIKKIISETIKPEFDSKPLEFKEIAKRTLSYYLTTDKIEFGGVYDSNLIAFDHPDNPKNFFIWIWEVLFGNESYRMEDWQNYIEVNDYDEPLAIMKKYRYG